MPRGHPLVPLKLTDEQQHQLNGIARSATLPHALVQRAGMILASTEGLSNAAVARRGVTPQTVGKWRSLSSPASRACTTNCDRPRTYDDDKVAAISRALQQTPEAARTGAWGVSRDFQEHGAALVRLFQAASGEDLQAVQRSVLQESARLVGLYLNPPARCVDEKSQIQAAPNRAADGPGLRRGLHPWSVLHGTTTLFAALDIEEKRDRPEFDSDGAADALEILDLDCGDQRGSSPDYSWRP